MIMNHVSKEVIIQCDLNIVDISDVLCIEFSKIKFNLKRAAEISTIFGLQWLLYINRLSK